jgi:hypothetical protein
MKIILLTYVNRSGSTFLTNILSSSPEIMGCPEGDWLVSNLLEDPGSVYTGPQNLSEIFSDDPKMKNWSFQASDLNFMQDGLLNIEVFIHILESMRLRIKPDADKIIFKAERLVFLFDRIHACQSFRDQFAYLYLVRDVRAVYQSQKSRLNPLSGKPFSRSPGITARYWKKHLAALESSGLYADIYKLKYENLVLDFASETKKLEKYLELRPGLLDPVNGDYVNMIPADHIHIHPDVSLQPLDSKVSSWKTLLTKKETGIIEFIARRSLERNGYDPVGAGRTLDPVTIVMSCLVILQCSLTLFFRKIEFRIRNFG